MILYDLILLIGTFLASIKKPHHFKRFFAPIPDCQGKEVIWIHAVSVGETKSVQSLFLSLRRTYPNAFFLVTTTTAAGQAEARRSLPTADAFAYLPIDLTWLTRRWVRTLHPKLFILVESDFWPNLLSAVKKSGGKTVLVSGKLSERSARRFAAFPYFTKKLFSRLDFLCVQNEEHASRFLPFVDPDRLKICGNLKLDYQPPFVDAAHWRQKIDLSKPALTLSCTHAPEEEELLDLLPLDSLVVFLAPRHPERFEEVAQILEQKRIPYIRWSRLEEKRGGEKVILVDAMGQLPICYSLSRLAIVAGSFQPHIGGHNILEPCFYGIPVLFGPYMFSQKELVSRVLSAKAGMQTSYDALPGMIQTFFSTPSQEADLRAAAIALIDSSRGASEVTFKVLQSFLEKV